MGEKGEGWRLGQYLEGGIGFWRSGRSQAEIRALGEVALSTVLQVSYGPSDSATLYLEAGFGIHLLSNSGPSELSTALQFGSHAGIGLLFGKGCSDLSLRLPLQRRHQGGIDFALLRLGVNF